MSLLGLPGGSDTSEPPMPEEEAPEPGTEPATPCSGVEFSTTTSLT